MRNESDYIEVKRLLALKLNQCQVAKQTGIPRGTIRDWIARGFRPKVSHSKVIRITDPDAYLNTKKLRSAYAFMLGEYLGDGCIRTFPREVYRLDIYNDKKYERLNQLIASKMKVVFPYNSVHRISSGENCWDIYVYSKNIPILFPQMGNGRKHKRKIKLTSWQLAIVDDYPKEFLRGLFYSDGCIFDHRHHTGNKEYIYICYTFSQKSRDIMKYLLRSLRQIGIDKELYKHPNGHYVLQNLKKEQRNILATFLPKRTDI